MEYLSWVLNATIKTRYTDSLKYKDSKATKFKSFPAINRLCTTNSQVLTFHYLDDKLEPKNSRIIMVKCARVAGMRRERGVVVIKCRFNAPGTEKSN